MMRKMRPRTLNPKETSQMSKSMMVRVLFAFFHRYRFYISYHILSRCLYQMRMKTRTKMTKTMVNPKPKNRRPKCKLSEASHGPIFISHFRSNVKILWFHNQSMCEASRRFISILPCNAFIVLFKVHQDSY